MRSPATIFAAAAGLVAVFVVALVIGQSTGSTEEPAAAASELPAVELPGNATRTPSLADTGAVPDLRRAPAPDTGSTGTSVGSGTNTGSGTTTSSSAGGGFTPSAPSVPSGGGGGATPAPPVGR